MTERSWPDLATLELLSSVARTGSINQAAELHGISQPAASWRLRRLEELLGVTLLRRTRSGAQLTPDGSAVVGWAERVLTSARDLLEGVEALTSDGHAALRLAASLTVAEYLLPGWVTPLTRQHPDLALSLRMANSTDVVRLFERGEVDLGFVEGARAPAGMQGRTVWLDELVVVVAPEHRLARRRSPLGPAHLASTPLVAREVGSGTREVLERALAQHGLVPSVALELASTTAIKSAVAEGDGVAVLSLLAVARELADGRLRLVPVVDLDLSRAIRAVWPRSQPLNEYARALLEGIRHTG